MTLNWLECLIYGILSGFAEFLPVSAPAHQAVYLKLLGQQDHPALRLGAYTGALAAVLIFSWKLLARIRKEQRIARIPKSRRRRQPDAAVLIQGRVLRTATVCLLVPFLFYRSVSVFPQRLWILGLTAAINGIVLYVPQFLPGANKTALSLSPLDAALVGFGAGLGVIPGISRVGMSLAVAQVRGTDRSYAVELALALSVPALAVLTGITAFSAVSAGITGGAFLGWLLSSLGSFGASCLTVMLIRFLSVRMGFGGFAYYCWGFALFTWILYLI